MFWDTRWDPSFLHLSGMVKEALDLVDLDRNGTLASIAAIIRDFSGLNGSEI